VRSEEHPRSIPLKRGELDFSRTLVMGILNVTPDSFSDGGRFYDPIRAIQHARRMVKEGADIIDVGGESTRPGSEGVPLREELKRVVPVIEALVQEVEVPISVDTTKAEVAARALEAGADIVNDIGAMRMDPEMATVVAEHNAVVILMHMKGTPRDMQKDPQYRDVLEEVYAFLQQRIERAEERGVSPDRIIVDPGIGFGKTVEHNLILLKGLRRLRDLGKPVMVGTSRKSFIGRILNLEVDKRLIGTAATAAASILNGADIIRVHDVAAMVQVARMTDAIMKAPL
jgi:dihydropteroate synthase